MICIQHLVSLANRYGNEEARTGGKSLMYIMNNSGPNILP